MSEFAFITARLGARGIGWADVDALLGVYGDREVVRWVGDGQPLDRAACERWVDVTQQNYRARGYGMWALQARDTDAVVGFCGLVHPGGQAQAEIKYAFLRSRWGQGLATEAASALLAYGASHCGLTEVIATTAPENAASHRVLRKAGMQAGALQPNDDGSWTQYFVWRPDPVPPTQLPLAFPGGVLRRLRVEDLPAFQAYRSIPALGRFQGWSPMSDAQAREFLSEMGQAPLLAAGRWMQLGIAWPDTDQLVGDVGIWVADDGATAEVGFTLAPQAQGRGLATAAVRRALQLIFTRTAVTQVEGISDQRNTPSVRLLQRLGFGLQDRRAAVFRGEPCTEEVYVLPRPSPAGRQT